MQIVRDLAGYSYGRSDLVRRAMAKKKHDVMAKEKEIFIHGQVENGKVTVPGAVRNGVPEDVAEHIFDEMTAFASYAFNKSHAAAYALVAVQTAWLKLHWPVQFMAALMNSLSGNSDKVGYYIQTCRKRGIRVLPPDVNKSQEKFSVENGAIRFGFAGVKNLGHGAIQAIVSEREAGGPYRDIFDLCERVACAAVNKKCVESLIRAGAMDGLPGSRSQKLCVFERAMDAAGRRQKTAVQGQLSLFDAVEDVEIAPPPLPDVPDFSRQEQLRMEREVTGVYITGHPLDEYEAVLSKLEVDSQALQSLSEEADGGMSWDQKPVTMGGIVAERKVKATKSGTMMAFVQLEDMYGLTEVLVFPKVYDRVGHLLTQDAPVLLTGRLSVREEESPKLLLDSVRPLSGESAEAPRAKEAVHKLFIKCPDALREEALAILRQTPGNIPVILVSAETGRAQRAPQKYWVDEGYDFFRLANLLGEKNVVYK